MTLKQLDSENDIPVGSKPNLFDWEADPAPPTGGRGSHSINPTEVFDGILEEYRSCWGWLGAQIAEEVILSMIGVEATKSNKRIPIRLRRHLLFAWPPGWSKTAMLRPVRAIFGDRANWITTISDAVMRGSVSEDNMFIPPEVLVSDIMLIPDLVTLLTGSTAEGVAGQLLPLLEEGFVRVALVKLGTKSAAEQIRTQMRDHEITIENGRMAYKTNAIMMAATHERPRFIASNALRDRFVIVVPEHELDDNLLRSITTINIENEFKSHAEDMHAALYKIREYCQDLDLE